jgi:hypothetical protein
MILPYSPMKVTHPSSTPSFAMGKAFCTEFTSLPDGVR